MKKLCQSELPDESGQVVEGRTFLFSTIKWSSQAQTDRQLVTILGYRPGWFLKNRGKILMIKFKMNILFLSGILAPLKLLIY